MAEQSSVRVRVSGPWACFTRPEMKVERVSYPAMTPSAARGLLEAILWKPQFRWGVERIEVLRPIRFQAIRRNEVQSKIAPRTVAKWMEDPASFEPLLADFMGSGDGDERSERTPRSTLALREVSYIVQARVMLTPLANRPRQRPPDADEDPGPDSVAKYVSMFNRRVENGQCWQRPYLGCREFAADFESAKPGEQPIEDSGDFGQMLYDIAYSRTRGNAPVWFRARMERGVLECDPDRVLEDPSDREALLTCSSNV